MMRLLNNKIVLLKQFAGIIIITAICLFMVSCPAELSNGEELADLQICLPVAAEVAGEVGGSHVDILFVHDTNYLTSRVSHFIEMNVDESQFLRDSIFTKEEIAAYCASQLYSRLDSSILEKHSAINIVFDNDRGFIFDYPYYYTYDELATAWKAFGYVDAYLHAIQKGDSALLKSSIDTSFFSLNVRELNSSLSKRLRTEPYTTSHFYERYHYTNKDSTRQFECYAINTNIDFDTSKSVSFSFMIPMDSGNRIINYRLPIEDYQINE